MKVWVRWAIAVSILLAAVVLIVYYLRLGLIWYLSPETKLTIVKRKDLVQGLASVVQAVAVLVAGVVGLGGLYFTWRNLNQTRQLTEQGQITERFTRAIDQLGETDDDGDPRLEIRLGGIYALERIDKESRERAYHSTVMEVLTAYVRENAPWPPKSSEPPEFRKPPGAGSISDSSSNEAALQDKGTEQGTIPAEKTPPTDIQAILNVLKRRKEEKVPVQHRIESLDPQDTNLRRVTLGEADLKKANLARAHLERAYLYKARLEGANLYQAHLEEATLGRAHLERAYLNEAHLEGAILVEAHLEGANLGAAHLEGAYLTRAHLEGVANLYQAHLEGAYLEGVIGLTPEQLERTIGDENTQLPDYLINDRPQRWRKPPEEQMEIIDRELRKLASGETPEDE
jgi:hypothetical protein